jgi:hypothetical protein
MILLLFLVGCTYDDVQRLGYFAVGNLHQYQCQRAMMEACSEPSFAEYLRQRQEVSK